MKNIKNQIYSGELEIPVTSFIRFGINLPKVLQIQIFLFLNKLDSSSNLLVNFKKKTLKLDICS